MLKRHRALATAASLAAVIVATPALAAPVPSNADLAGLVRAQAAQIAQLKARIDALEARETSRPETVASNGASQQPAGGAPQAAGGEAATRDQAITQLQTQVAQLREQSHRNVKVNWKNGGPTLSSDDGFFTFHPRGRVLVDISHTSGSDYPSRNITGTELRDVRLGVEGRLGRFGYKFETGFTNSNGVSIKDAYVSYNTKLWGNAAELYLGDKFNDRGIDGGSALPNVPFMERNAVADVVIPQIGYYGLGAMGKLIGKNWHVAVQIKGDGPGGNDGTHNDSVAYVARATLAPIKWANGFVHLGAWGFHEELDRSTTSINKTSKIATDFNGDVRVAAGAVPNVKSDDGYGFEAGAVYRSLWGFGEYGDRIIHVYGTGADASQKAWSVYGGWFITGDTPGFSSSNGSWGRPKIARPFTDGGPGGFEIMARYDDFDFKGSPTGGNGHAVTLGGAWYLNNWADLKLNYIRWTTNNLVTNFKGHDTGNTIALRGEVAF